jgi:hypothetical protein
MDGDEIIPTIPKMELARYRKESGQAAETGRLNDSKSSFRGKASTFSGESFRLASVRSCRRNGHPNFVGKSGKQQKTFQSTGRNQQRAGNFRLKKLRGSLVKNFLSDLTARFRRWIVRAVLNSWPTRGWMSGNIVLTARHTTMSWQT